METNFTIEDIKALDNFKKLSKLGWSIVSTKRQLINKTIVLDHKLFEDISTVVFFKYPYIVDGHSEYTANGKNLKYTRNQQYIKQYSTVNLSEKNFFINAFDFFINEYMHDKKYLITKKLYKKHVNITKSDKLFVITHDNIPWYINSQEVHAKLSSSFHMLEFDNDFQDLTISSYNVTKKIPAHSAKMLHISMQNFNELSRFYDNIIYKRKNIRLSNYDRARESKDGNYSQHVMDNITKYFHSHETHFSRAIDNITNIINSHPGIPVNYHKRNITNTDDLWKIVNEKMKGYKEFLSKLEHAKDYKFYRGIMKVLNVQSVTPVKVLQEGEQFGFFNKD